MTARTHPGAVTHCWDHLVITLRTPDGTESAFLSLYAIAYSATLGAGHVAYLEVASGPGGPIALTLADDPELGRRQQARLAAMGDERMRASGDPVAARFEREPWGPDGFGFRIVAPDLTVQARWIPSGPPFWVDGQAGGFSDEEDIWAMFVEANAATIAIDGRPITGQPFDDPVWRPKLGRSLSSAHGAFAEVRVVPR